MTHPATTWEQIHRARPWGRWPAEEVVRTLAPWRNRGLRVLDIGCGAGAHLWYLAREGFRPVGLDIAHAALERAVARCREERVRAPVAQADSRRLPVRDAAFDLVLDVQAFSCLHERDVPTAWGEVARVLRPGGRFVSIGFTPATAAHLEGRRLAPRTLTDIRSGPLAGLGTISFLDPDALPTGTSPALEIEDTQLRSRTTGPDHLLIEELIVVAVSRPAAGQR